MLEQKPRLELANIRTDVPNSRQQRHRMFLAIAVLVAALMVVVIKDWHFWFGRSDVSTADEVVEASAPSSHPPARVLPSSAKPVKPTRRAISKSPTEQVTEPPAIVTTNRTPLPPLEVEVVAGDTRHLLRPRNSSVKVEMPVDPSTDAGEKEMASSTPTAQATVNAAQRVKMSADTTRALDRPVDPSYPLLARQMKVQGVVVLQALIGIDGTIQDLRVLSGPSILASAAREAVRQWRFKPYLQKGQPVETEANITVNFTISTS